MLSLRFIKGIDDCQPINDLLLAYKNEIYRNIRINCPVFERWTLIAELGKDSFGNVDVYKAQQTDTDRLSAAKVRMLPDDVNLREYSLEIDILSNIKHENVVNLYEAYYMDKRLWVSNIGSMETSLPTLYHIRLFLNILSLQVFMEYCDGGSVDSIMRQLGQPLTEPQIAYLCKHITEGLHYLHKNKIIHGNIKASNVLLTMDGGVKLLKFGVPKNIVVEDFDYNYQADIILLGILLLDFAHQSQPNTVDNLEQKSRFSQDFNQFLSKITVNV